MTTCVKPDELEQWYILASDEPPPQELQNETEQRQKAKECARTLAECLEEQCYHTCQGIPPHHCSLPNVKKTPDILVGVVLNPRNHLKFPIFIFEVIEKKKIMGVNERHIPGFRAVMQALTFAPYAYYSKVDDKSVTLYKFQKIPKDRHIEITYKDFRYAVPGQLGRALADIMDILTEIIFDVVVNLSWVQFESSHLLKSGGYKDFVASLNGKRKLIESHCWHLFETTYVGQHHFQPNECSNEHKEDNVRPTRHHNADPPRLTRDEIIPVLSSHATQKDMEDIFRNYKLRTNQSPFARPTTRALRDYTTGAPLDLTKSVHWTNAYNHFRVNRKFSTIRRTGIPITRQLAGELTVAQQIILEKENETEVQQIYNPNVEIPANMHRRPIVHETPDHTAQIDVTAVLDDEMEGADKENLANLGLEPHRTYGPSSPPPAIAAPTARYAARGKILSLYTYIIYVKIIYMHKRIFYTH